MWTNELMLLNNFKLSTRKLIPEKKLYKNGEWVHTPYWLIKEKFAPKIIKNTPTIEDTSKQDYINMIIPKNLDNYVQMNIDNHIKMVSTYLVIKLTYQEKNSPDIIKRYVNVYYLNLMLQALDVRPYVKEYNDKSPIIFVKYNYDNEKDEIIGAIAPVNINN